MKDLDSLTDTDELELAWAAGFFDGEGCTAKKRASGTNSNQIILSVSQKHREVLDRFMAAVGRGVVCGPYGPRRMHNLSVNGYDAVIAVMVLLWPHLGSEKRDQFRRTVEWLDELGGPPVGRGSPLCRRPGHVTRQWTPRGLLCVECSHIRKDRFNAKRRTGRPVGRPKKGT